MNNKTLWIVFIVLLLIYGASQLFTGDKNSSFDAQLVEIDTSKITTILLYTKAESQQEIRLDKQGNGWIATMDNTSVGTTSNSITGMLNHLPSIKTTRMVAKTSDKWGDYEVDEANGTKVIVMAGEEKLDEFVIGRFAFNQEKRTATTFMRLANNQEVYAVDGFLSMAFNRKFDSFRDKSFLNLNNSEVVQLEYTDHETKQSEILNKSAEGIWLNSNGEAQDSSTISNYLSNLNKMDGADFAKPISALSKEDLLRYTLRIKANNMAEEILISCFINDANSESWILQSDQYPDAYFASDNEGIFKNSFAYFQEK